MQIVNSVAQQDLDFTKVNEVNYRGIFEFHFDLRIVTFQAKVDQSSPSESISIENRTGSDASLSD